ncbi:MAG: diacylglycerol kinase family lipid kinase [Deltaproteobacteria bacterium]|nr:diacylglycerol kinase family lipid kinase [Deltaproteobacteria bacterium]
MNPFFIVNPHSANGATKRRFGSMEPTLRAAFPDMKVAYTEGPMHAATLSGEAVARGDELVVACGGDGTLNEVIQPVAGTGCKTVIAVMPSGTGGDFRRMLGLKTEAEDIVGYLRHGEPRTVDTGILEYANLAGGRDSRAFMNIASCGISGQVDHYVNNTSKALGGRASFLIGSLRGMFGYRNVEMSVKVDDRPFYEGPANLVAVANGRFFGGGMMVAPGSSLDDGLFDVVVFGDLTKLEFIGLSRRIYSGHHLTHPKIRHGRGSTVEVESRDQALIDLDGEQVGGIPMRAGIRPASLRLLVPGRGAGVHPPLGVFGSSR